MSMSVERVQQKFDLPRDLVDAIEDRVRAEKVTKRDWIENAIRHYLNCKADKKIQISLSKETVESLRGLVSSLH
jgi:metal-responsive CopG/Arc/MetJ family transcriptional regulator